MQAFWREDQRWLRRKEEQRRWKERSYRSHFGEICSFPKKPLKFHISLSKARPTRKGAGRISTETDGVSKGARRGYSS